LKKLFILVIINNCNVAVSFKVTLFMLEKSNPFVGYNHINRFVRFRVYLI
jgi:hypothetical protein